MSWTQPGSGTVIILKVFLPLAVRQHVDHTFLPHRHITQQYMSLAVRIGASFLAVASRTRPICQPLFGTREPIRKLNFSTSKNLRAQENPLFPNVDDAEVTIPAKIRQVLENPELVAAINNLNTVAKEEGMSVLLSTEFNAHRFLGVDTFNAKPTPSLMLKVALNPKLRDAFNQFREKVEASGITFTPEVCGDRLSVFTVDIHLSYSGNKAILNDYEEPTVVERPTIVNKLG
jgi:hypothetical protein